MKIVAKVENSMDSNNVTLQTDEIVKQLSIPAKPNGLGYSVNGGEFLMLAWATCFCNDIYREAKKREIRVTNVFVEASGECAAEGEAGFNIFYKCKL
jgi:organic hydroperoxide reductase OsmC/OhrA